MACQNGCSANTPTHQSPKYKKALWIVLILNLSMFFVEIVMGLNRVQLRCCRTVWISWATVPII